MDVATSMISSVVPHSYPVGAEEARQTAQRHAENPQVLAMQQSANAGTAADSRGSTALSNSHLYAQSEALISASSDQIKKTDRKAVDTQKGREKTVKERNASATGSKNTSASSGTASTAATSASTATSSAFNGELNRAQGMMATSEYTGEVEHAKYSKETASQLGEEHETRTSAIAKRYNKIVPANLVGTRVNLQA
ncbi:MAG: hypothetical protein K6F05_03420 [Succinivibrio sp.]|nr:hypothetical protein [Succinivibrio sp.]